MPETITQDEVVFNRGGSHGAAPRPMTNESINSATGAVTVDKNPSAVNETVKEGGGKGRVFKESTLKLLEKLEAAADEDEGDADDEGDEDDAEGGADEGEAEGDADDEGDEGDDAEGDESGTAQAKSAESTDEETPPDEDIVKEWQTRATQLEDSNRALLAGLETARATPKRERTAHEQTLVDAYAAYVDEGSVPALRKFIGAAIGAAADSKEVDEELSGLYADLTARELNVPLDQSQKAMREAARARLALARDKRERADSEKKPDQANAGETAQIEQASRYIDNMLAVKGQKGASLADEFPMLMALSEDIDGVKPSELLARAIKREYQVGTLPPTMAEHDVVRTVARKIETYYDGLRAKFSKANPKTDTTNSGNPKKPAAADKASTEQRQSPGARTITNAAASVAPGTKPKLKQKTQATQEKTRKDFPNDKAWKNYCISKHIPA